MNNKLLIRFYRNKEDGIPADSFEILETDIQSAVVRWKELYPNGKVDFIWNY